MTPSIQPLSAELARRIAAGEVIDSLAAVVRELVDNALDADATRIQIALWPDQGRVQVSDNGIGLPKADLLQAALPHTTSKIAAFEHLSNLHTLGFRGEALHSLAQLGRLDICSRIRAGDTGLQAVYNPQGQVIQMQDIALAPGTTVTVTHLFEHWPSRQQTLTPTALRSLQTMIGDYALCHPQVTWQVFHQDRPWFSLAPGNTPDTLLQLVPKLAPADLRHSCVQMTVPPPLATQETGSLPLAHPGTGTLELLIGLPDRYHRRRPDWIRVAVNGRRVAVNAATSADRWTLGPLESTILNAFRQTLPRHRYPLCWVHFQIPATYADWNRTAAKSHIYLDPIEAWQAQLGQCIRESLNLSPQKTAEEGSSRVTQLLKTAENRGRYDLTDATINLSSPLPGTPESAAELPQGTLRAIAQLHQTYIVAEHPVGLWLVEQHIAHERVLYEQLCQNWQLVDLHTPLMLHNLTENQVQNLAHIGLDISPFGTHTWTIRTAPQHLKDHPDCREALYELSHCSTLQPALVATACRSAIRNGISLSLIEMQSLLDRWQQTQNPRTCPHGRPIYLRLDEQALAKFFRRHWVISKSHSVQST